MTHECGERPTNDWCSGDLPAPYAVGDEVEVPPGARAIERLDGMGPGRYVVDTVWSIDEGDGWYVRVTPHPWRPEAQSSDRLHVVSADPTRISSDLAAQALGMDWLEGCTLARTVDPEGLATRTALLAAGWVLDGIPPNEGAT